jgi:hypothetical protein
MEKEERTSFLKKRSKKLLLLVAAGPFASFSPQPCSLSPTGDIPTTSRNRHKFFAEAARPGIFYKKATASFPLLDRSAL